MQQGLIHIYTGDGKGKTTAALGLIVRACGTGGRILFAQFLKGLVTSEIDTLEQLGIEIERTPEVKKFIPFMTDQEKEVCRHSQMVCFERVSEKLQNNNYFLVVLDEVLDAINSGMIEEELLYNLLKNKPPQTEIVLTGRAPSNKIKELADYISEIQNRKHPFSKGITARKGIEY